MLTGAFHKFACQHRFFIAPVSMLLNFPLMPIVLATGSQLLFIAIQNWYSQLVFTISIVRHPIIREATLTFTQATEHLRYLAHQLISTQPKFLVPRLGRNAQDPCCSSTMKLSTSGPTCWGLLPFSHFCSGILYRIVLKLLPG